MPKRPAKKKVSKKKTSKHYPVQRQINFEMQPASTSCEGRADHMFSAVNRRLMRQSRVYSLKVDLSADSPAGVHYEVFALRDNWVNLKSYNFAYKTFLENSKEEMGVKSRWNDFRVLSGFNSPDLAVPQATQNLTGQDLAIGGGEYQFTQVTNAAGVANTLQWSGATGTSYNIISQYDLTANTDSDPSSPITSVAYDGLSDDTDDNQMEHLSDDGNLPPYELGLSPLPFVRVGTLNNDSGTTNQKLSTGYFEAPCGLFFIVASAARGGHQGSSRFTLCAKPGDYKGVHAPSYLE